MIQGLLHSVSTGEWCYLYPEPESIVENPLYFCYSAFHENYCHHHQPGGYYSTSQAAAVHGA